MPTRAKLTKPCSLVPSQHSGESWHSPEHCSAQVDHRILSDSLVLPPTQDRRVGGQRTRILLHIVCCKTQTKVHSEFLLPRTGVDTVFSCVRTGVHGSCGLCHVAPLAVKFTEHDSVVQPSRDICFTILNLRGCNSDSGLHPVHSNASYCRCNAQNSPLSPMDGVRIGYMMSTLLPLLQTVHFCAMT